MNRNLYLFFFSSRRRHTRWPRDWSSDVCSSDLCFHSPPPGIKSGIPRRFQQHMPGRVLFLIAHANYHMRAAYPAGMQPNILFVSQTRQGIVASGIFSNPDFILVRLKLTIRRGVLVTVAADKNDVPQEVVMMLHAGFQVPPAINLPGFLQKG